MGLPGMIIAGLAFAVRTLYKRNCDIQDARIAEGREATLALNSNTVAFNALTQRINDILASR